jgi:hypothetical protein
MTGPNQQAQKKRDVQGVTFNVEGFMDQIFTTVDLNSSDMGTKPNELIDGTLNVVAREKQESRLNTFYRLIGFPATRNEAKISNAESLSREQRRLRLSQQGTLNYFNQADLFIPGVTQGLVGDKVSLREAASRGLISPPKTTEDIIKMIEDPLMITESLLPTSRRISIIPIVVDAATYVVPIKKRMATMFNQGDFILSGASNLRLPRPFLENVIYLRSQRFTEDMAETVGDLLRNLDSFVLSGLADPEQAQNLLNTLGVPELNAVDESPAVNTSLVEIEIINKFVQAIKKSADEYRKVRNEAVKLNQEVDFRPAPKDTPKEKAGNSDVVVVGREKKRGIDKRIADLDTELERVNSLETTLPTARVQQADVNHRIANCDDVGRNIVRDTFLSEFTNLITFNREALERRKQDDQAERKRKLNDFERLKKRIQYFTGEFTGLSIFDVLCIFLALFTIDLNDLVSLLNQDARDRLQSSKFYTLNPDPTDTTSVIFRENDERTALIEAGLTQPVSQGLEALENKVAEHFRLAEAFFNEADKSGQNRG